MELAAPLPLDFDRHVYSFRDSKVRRGVFDVVFHGDQLVNFRAQLFFTGRLSRSKAQKYLKRELVPLLDEILGTPIETSAGLWIYRCNGLVIVARQVCGTDSISTYITDQAYV